MTPRSPVTVIITHTHAPSPDADLPPDIGDWLWKRYQAFVARAAASPEGKSSELSAHPALAAAFSSIPQPYSKE